MPTYHFRCNDCHADFSIHMPMGSTEMPACQTCSTAKRVVKIIKPPMIHFKGSGFYKTDSAEQGQKERKEVKEIKETKDVKAPEGKKEAPKPSAQANGTSK